MYLYTIQMIPQEWRGTQIPVEPPAGYRLHSASPLPGDRLLFVWEIDETRIAVSADAARAWLEA